MDRKALAMFVTQAAIWGSSFSMIKLANRGLTPAQLVFVRLLLGAGVLAAAALIVSVSLRMSARTWVHTAVASVFANVIPYLLLSYGEQHASASIGGVLVAGTPMLTLLLSVVVFVQETATLRKVLGFILGFIGVIIVLSPWSDAGGSVLARLACFGAAVSYAVGYAYVGRFMNSDDNHPLTLATNQLVAATALMVPVLALAPWRTPHWDTQVITGVVLLGALSSGFANILYFGLIRAAGASTASAVDYLVPIFAVVFGVLILGERLHASVLLGGVIVLIGMALSEGRLHLPGRSSATESSTPATAICDGAPGAS